LLNKEQLADILFDATRDGTSLLVGSNSGPGIQVGCRDVETNAYFPIAVISINNRPGIYASFSPDGTDILVSNDEIEKSTDWIAGCGGDAPQQFETLALPYQQYFSTGSSWLVMEQTHAFGEENAKIVVRELKSGQVREVPAALQTSTTWFQMPERPLVPSSAASMEVSPAGSAVPAGTAQPVSMQDGLADNKMVMISLLLWAGALVAIMFLMLYLWRNWSVPPKPENTTAAKPAIEEKIIPAAETTLEPSHEALEKAFQDGVNLVRAGNASEGIDLLTRVIKAEPENEVAWFWLGIASARQKDHRSAERCFLQAKRHGHPEADKALEWLKGQKT
jgi:TolA-binding protein